MVKPLDNDKTDPGENLSERTEDRQAPDGKITFTADQNKLTCGRGKRVLSESEEAKFLKWLAGST